MAFILSNMVGVVSEILVNIGDSISEGQDVAVLESMKMHIPITTESSGTVKAIIVNEGDFVNEGDILLEVE